MKPLVFIISAPSGSGKSTLVNRVRTDIHNLTFSVSYTTRPTRGSERNGYEYYFVSRDEFKRMIANDEFLEYAEVFGNYYGTAKRFLREAEASGNDLLLDIDVQGAEQVKKKLPEARSIFILPPSHDELKRRLERRTRAEEELRTQKTPPEILHQTIQKRLDGARREIENYPKYDYILVNDRLEDSIEHLEAILACERFKHTGEHPANEQQLKALADPCLQAQAHDKLQPIIESFQLIRTPSGK
jgi:guanylate kinase